jgi:HAD superfamily hydrolase (TIGR01509 family)
MQFKAAIFDLDGLMIDSEGIAFRVWQQLVAGFGVEMTENLYRQIIGKAPGVGARFLRDQLGLSIDPEVLRQTYWELRTEVICAEAEPLEGLVSLIQSLLQRRMLLGVASNSPTGYVEKILQALSLRTRFSSVMGSDLVGHGKPAPDVYLAVAAALEVAPEACLAIEDSPTGVTAAIEAGMTCYAVPNHELRALDFSMADMLFPSLTALHEHLDEAFRSEESGDR